MDVPPTRPPVQTSTEVPEMHRITHLVITVAVITVATCAAALTVTGTSVADAPDWPDIAPGEYVIELTPDADPQAVAAATGATIPLEPLGPGELVHRLVLEPTTDPQAVIDALLNTDGIALAQPNLVLGTTDALLLRKRFFTDLDVAQVTASDAGYRIRQRALANAGLPAGAPATGVRVAVLDTGVDLAHPRLSSRLLSNGYDFVDRDATPGEVANGVDENGNGAVDEAFGHGTYVAGLVALVAPGARILPVRVLDSDGSSTTWTVMQGLAFAAARGVTIVNLSLGGPTWGPVAERQLEHLANSGVIVVAAAGNDASPVEVYPAGSPHVVGVASIDGARGAAATFSNRGSWISVAAPGVAITSTYPGARYATWGGTSASAPIVSGVLAISTRLMPGAPISDVIDTVTSTARPESLDGLSANGRIDAAAAVVAALD